VRIHDRLFSIAAQGFPKTYGPKLRRLVGGSRRFAHPVCDGARNDADSSARAPCAVRPRSAPRTTGASSTGVGVGERKFFDAKLRGVDLAGDANSLPPDAEKAKDDEALYGVVNAMLGDSRSRIIMR